MIIRPSATAEQAQAELYYALFRLIDDSRFELDDLFEVIRRTQRDFVWLRSRLSELVGAGVLAYDNATHSYRVANPDWLTGAASRSARNLLRDEETITDLPAKSANGTAGQEGHRQGACGHAHDLVVDFGGPRPDIVTLCGSTRFFDAFAAANLSETVAGRIVLSIGCDTKNDDEVLAGFVQLIDTPEDMGDVTGEDLYDILKQELDELHKRKIDIADQVLFLNVGGYLGKSSLDELAYARRLGKQIRWLEPVCDGTSVGVLITNADGQFLMFDRATAPAGVAPAAGHAAEHGDTSMEGFAKAARIEVSEELGLTVTELTSMTAYTGGWRTNACRRHPAPGTGGHGHHWEIFQAQVTGELQPSERETRNARWLNREELQHLALRTAGYAAGLVTEAAFTDSPGIEPVWCQWLMDLGLISLSTEALEAIDRLAARPPAKPTFELPGPDLVAGIEA